MEIIDELEPAAAASTPAPSAGSPAGGALSLAIIIRTAVIARGALHLHVGGGIVADSRPARELAEAWLKTQAIRLALGEEPSAELECSSG